MIAFILKYRYALVVIVALIALNGYIAWEKHKARRDEKQKAAIERVESENKTIKADIVTRKKQNEIIVRDITPSEFDSILQKRTF